MLETNPKSPSASLPISHGLSWKGSSPPSFSLANLPCPPPFQVFASFVLHRQFSNPVAESPSPVESFMAVLRPSRPFYATKLLWRLRYEPVLRPSRPSFSFHFCLLLRAFSLSLSRPQILNQRRPTLLAAAAWAFSPPLSSGSPLLRPRSLALLSSSSDSLTRERGGGNPPNKLSTMLAFPRIVFELAECCLLQEIFLSTNMA